MPKKPNESDRKPLGTIDDVARYLCVTPRHVHNLVKTKRIKAIRLGRALRFDIDEIAKQLNDED